MTTVTGNAMHRQTERANYSIGPAFALTPMAHSNSAPFVFAALEADFDLVERIHGDDLEIFDVDFGVARARFRVAGSALAAHMRVPYRHRAGAPDLSREPDLRIDIWDGAATAIDCSARPADPKMGPYGMATVSPNQRYVAYQRPTSTCWLDRKSERVIAWFDRADNVHLDERAKPIHKQIAIWLRARNVIMTHAGMVGRNGRGLMVTGISGSGKSTTATSCLLAGFDFLADDFVGLRRDEAGTFVADGYFACTVLETNHVDRFPRLASIAEPPKHAYESKVFCPIDGPFAGQFKRTLPVHAIVLPRIAGGSKHRLRRASPVRALLGLAPSTLFQLPLPRPAIFDTLVELATEVPAYFLDMCPDVDSLPEALAPLLES